MKKRGRHKKITYDSNETKVAIGLVLLLGGIVGILSLFAEGSIFDLIQDIFGMSTIFFSLATLGLAFKLLGFAQKVVTTQTVFGLFLIAIALSLYFSGAIGMPTNVKLLSYDGEYGGVVGYELSEIIGDNLFREAIRPLSIIITFLSIPLILSMKMSDYFRKIGEAIGFVSTKAKLLGENISKSTKGNDKEEQMEFDPITSPAMVGDLRKVKTGSFVGKSPDFAGVDNAALQKKHTIETYGGNNAGHANTASANYVPKEQVGASEKGMIVQDKLLFPDWKLPPIELLKAYNNPGPSSAGVEKNKKIIEQTLRSFGVNANVVDVHIGPTVTQYALDIALGTKVSKIANLRSDLALALATPAESVRVEAPISGTSYVGIEIPNEKRQMISFRELVIDPRINDGLLMVTVGRDIAGDVVLADIQKMPHLLIAGATGSGKSVVTNSFIMSLLMRKTPDEVRFIMIDPKQVEFSDYNGIPHLLTPVITDMEKVNNALKWAIVEMESRYTEFKDTKVRNIEEYNKKLGFTAMPYIVIVIDEMADMMMSRGGPEIESSIVKLAQKARATGMHLILATQRPSVDVITGLIKANIPGRIGMSVTTLVDSRVILDQMGAESLLGRGDMLFRNPGQNKLERIQGPFISQEEVIGVVDFIKNQTPDDLDFGMEITKPIGITSDSTGEGSEGSQFSDDELFAQAARIVVNAGKASSSLIQRKLSVGYNRAARLLDELYENGVVGAPNGSKPRDILISDIEAFLVQPKEVPVE
jgi:DNA segregation ATPase FtsK/SpoIIIE-like protein